MAKRNKADEGSQLRKWRGHYLVSRSAIDHLRKRVGLPPCTEPRTRGLDPTRWTDDPVGLAVRSFAENHRGGWVVGLADLADRLEIDVEGLLTFVVVTELRSRVGKRGELDLRGKRPEFTPDEARRHLAFLDAVKDAALAAARAKDPASTVRTALAQAFPGVLLCAYSGSDDRRPRKARGEASTGLDLFFEEQLTHDDELIAGVVSRLSRFKGRPADLAMDMLREREPRLRIAVANPADLRRNLKRAALRRPAHEGARYRHCRESAEAALRELASQRLKPPPK